MLCINKMKGERTLKANSTGLVKWDLTQVEQEGPSQGPHTDANWKVLFIS